MSDERLEAGDGSRVEAGVSMDARGDRLGPRAGSLSQPPVRLSAEPPTDPDLGFPNGVRGLFDPRDPKVEVHRHLTDDESDHPWKGFISGTTVSIVPNSSLYLEVFTGTDEASAGNITDYNFDDGATGLTLTGGSYVAIKLTIDADGDITGTDLVVIAPGGLDGDFYNLSGASPDYIDEQYIPIGLIIDNGGGDTSFKNIITDHIRLSLACIDGYVGYIPV